MGGMGKGSRRVIELPSLEKINPVLANVYLVELLLDRL